LSFVLGILVTISNVQGKEVKNIIFSIWRRRVEWLLECIMELMERIKLLFKSPIFCEA
jgi:hypothetical protein